MGAVRTFGHGTASEAEIAGLLRDGGVELVVDVRTARGAAATRTCHGRRWIGCDAV
jgi:hypothetical protein